MALLKLSISVCLLNREICSPLYRCVTLGYTLGLIFCPDWSKDGLYLMYFLKGGKIIFSGYYYLLHHYFTGNFCKTKMFFLTYYAQLGKIRKFLLGEKGEDEIKNKCKCSTFRDSGSRQTTNNITINKGARESLSTGLQGCKAALFLAEEE